MLDLTGDYEAALTALRFWKPAAMEYDAWHRELIKRMGPARLFACADCGQQARDWSYNGGAPDQIIGAKGYPYVCDPSFYAPRCSRCHSHHDHPAKHESAGQSG